MNLRNAYYNEENKTIYGTHNNGGFYSCINEVRFAIYELIKKNIYPENVSFINTLNSSRNYSDNKDLYPYLYKTNFSLLKNLKNENFEYDGWWANWVDLRSLNLKQIKMVEEIYFSPSDLVLENIEFLTAKYGIKYQNTIAAFHRGTDKHFEVCLAPISEWTEHIEKRIGEQRLLIQTDDLNTRDTLLSKFINSFFFEEMIFSDTYVKPIKNKIKWCIDFESIVRIISRCNSIVTHAGNCGVVPIFYRANLEKVSQCNNKGQFVFL